MAAPLGAKLLASTIAGIALAIYAACVDFMLRLAALLGITYRDANALVLLVVFPAVTLVLLAIVVVQARQLRRRERRARAPITEA